MSTRRVVPGVILSALVLAGCLAAQEMKVPDGCIAAPGASAGEMGYATEVIHEKTGVSLVLIPSGSFQLKSAELVPVTDVTFAEPYYIGKHTVTNKPYKQFLAESGYDGAKDCDPGHDLHVRHLRGVSIMPAGDDYPVVFVSWKNAKAFCNWAGGLDLPSEAEWEYACRAGTTTRFYFGDDAGNEKEIGNRYAWTHHNAERTTQPVGRLLPNGWGLYDMLGNVWEWCLDDEKPSCFRKPAMPADGSAYIEKDEAAIVVKGITTKILRGSSWSNTLYPVSMTFNAVPVVATNDIGFRVVLRLK